MPRTAIPKADFLTGTTSYVKLGKDFYVMKKVRGITDPSEEAKEMYKKQYENATKELKDIVSEGMTTDWNKQLQKLNDEKTSKSVLIPPAKFNKAVMWLSEQKKMVDLRACVYHPVEVLATKNWLINYAIYDADDLPATLTNPRIAGNTELVITIKNDWYFPFFAGFDDKASKVYAFGITGYHSFSDHSLCIGNSRYADYKALNDKHLSEQISRVNTFSPASQEIRFRDTIIGWNTLLNKDTIVSINRKDGAAWTT